MPEDNSRKNTSKKYSPTKFKMSSKKIVPLEPMPRTNKVFTVHGKPGYIVAYFTKADGITSAFDNPFRVKVKSAHQDIHTLNIIGIYDRKEPDLEAAIMCEGYPHKQYCTAVEVVSDEEISAKAAEFGVSITKALNNCKYKYPNPLVYAGDTSSEGGTDMKDIMMRKDIILFCRTVYGDYLDDNEFFAEDVLMTPMFGDFEPSFIKSLF